MTLNVTPPMLRLIRGTLGAGVVLLGLAWSGCQRASPGQEGGGPRAYATRGEVRELASDGRSAVIRHEEIPGFMPRMTMQLSVRDTNELRGLTTGDTITFRLLVDAEEHWIDSVQRVGGSSGPSFRPLFAFPLRDLPELKTGDTLPDLPLLAETGETIRFSRFRGGALAFTFIFTRCPLPEFCPRMMRHFNRARNRLLADPAAPTNWHFLSLSFDPAHDTPETLTRYGRGYRGTSPDRWLLATADPDTLAELAPRLDLMVTVEGGGFSHNLRTVVLDTRGRIHRQFDGNEWTAEELADALVSAARVPSE